VGVGGWSEIRDASLELPQSGDGDPSLCRKVPKPDSRPLTQLSQGDSSGRFEWPGFGWTHAIAATPVVLTVVPLGPCVVIDAHLSSPSAR